MAPKFDQRQADADAAGRMVKWERALGSGGLPDFVVSDGG